MIENNEAKCGSKPALRSKTINFNWASMLATALVPFLPDGLQQSHWILPAVGAWFAIGNIVLRLLTKEAIQLWGNRDENKQGLRTP